MTDLTNHRRETVAAAIWDAFGIVPFSKVSRLTRSNFLRYADAAIEALSSEYSEVKNG